MSVADQVMQELYTGKELKQSDVCKKLGKERGNFGKVIKRLENKGLLKIRSNREGNFKINYISKISNGKPHDHTTRPREEITPTPDLPMEKEKSDPKPKKEYRPRRPKIELPLILLTEVIEDIQKRKLKGFNLNRKKYNDKPVREVFETTLKILQKKVEG